MSTRCAIAWLFTASLAIAAAPSYVIQSIAGSDFLGDGGIASKALLQTVEGVTADSLGNYYLADTDSHRIRRISPKGIITTIAGTGTPGFSGDNGPASLAQFNLPYGIASDFSGNLYIADFGNRCIRKISPNGIISTVAGLTPATQMAGPRNLAIDYSGNLYISDFLASRIFRLSPQGVFTAIAGSGSPAATALGDNGPPTLARLNNPAGLAIDPSGVLYIADSGNKRIRKISNGVITTLNVPVATPIGLAIYYASELFIADAGNAALLRVTNLTTDKPVVQSWTEPCRDIAVDNSHNILLASGNAVRIFNGTKSTAIAGGIDAASAGDESLAALAHLNHPLGLAHDPFGSLYIADSANKRIRRITPDGTIHTFLDGLATPSALTFDANSGNLFIADAGTHAILQYSPSGKLTTLAGANKQGFSGDNGPARKAQLNAPSALAYDPGTGILYIADEGNNRIRQITPDGNIQTLAPLQAPAGLALDSSAHLYASESATGRIVQISPSGLITPIPNAGLWTTPRGLAFASDGSLYVADPGAQRVTRIDPNGAITLAAGAGTRGFTGDGGPAPLATLDTPSTLATDPFTGAIYIADTANNRVRALTPVNTIAPIVAPQLIALINAASRAPATNVAAGELVTILGAGAETYDIQLNSTPVIPISTAPGEATIALPDSLDINGSIEIQLLSQGVPQARVTAPLAPAAIGVYASKILNEDGTPNSADNPSSSTGAITIFATGEGRIGAPLNATLDGQQLGIFTAAPSPDNPNILSILTFLPGGFLSSGAKPLQVTAGPSASQSGVMIYVR